MRFRFRFPTVPLAGWLAVGLALTVSAAPSSGPDLREFLVPHQHLGEVLKSSPKAVLLSAEQFAALWRDSRPAKTAEANLPPVPAVLRKAHYTGTPGDRFVTLRGELSAECLTDDWTMVPLPLDPGWIGAVKVDGQTAVQVSAGADNQKPAALNLVLRGKGPHALTVDFAVPVEDLSGRRILTMMSPGASEATLTLTVPDKVKMESVEPLVQQAGQVVMALPAESRPFTLTWSWQDLAPLETAAVFQQFKTSYLIDPVRLEADLEISWQSPLRPLPGQLALPLPADVTVLGVDGPEVQQWTLAGDQLVVDLLPGKRQDVSLRLVLERGLNVAEAAGPVKLALPAPVAAGVPRAAGQFSIFTTNDLRVRQVNAGALAERDDSRTPSNRMASAVGTWVFPVLPQGPEVEVQALRVQFAATLDTQISLSREAVRLKRWLSLTPRDGTLFSPALEGLAVGEEVETVTRPDGSEVVWRKTETGLVFPDNVGIAAGTTWPVVVSSRLDPAGWQAMSQAALSLNLTSARVPVAGKVNGYVALDFEDALLVSTTAATGLETRDPRQFAGVLPLTGRMAWSRLEDYQLNLTVARRAPEYDAAVVLYALPLLNSLEVEGALTLSIDRSPLREAHVVFPAEAAASVRWDSPLLAESVLEPDNISWRLRFHQETDGAPVLRFRLSVPLTDSTEAAPAGAGAPAAAPERRFKVAAPVPSAPGARRLQGTVVVEANTDTELGFSADGLNALDTLRAPVLEGYTPRHRLVSAWGWLGGAPALTVSGVRHRPGDLVSTVVDKLVLDTVVSQDGPVRHQALMEVRTAGDQYLDVVLPDQARILTLLVNEGAVKPVRNRQGGLRVPLSGNVAVVRLICECPGQPMGSAARQSLVPVTLDPALPVLDTRWQLHLPDGFTYDGFDSNLTAVTAGPPSTPGVVQLALAELNPLRGIVMSGKSTKGAVDYLPGGGGDSLSSREEQQERAEKIAAVLKERLKSQESEVEAARVEMMQLMKQYGIVDMSMMTSRGLSPTIGTSDDSYLASKQSELQVQTKIAVLRAQQESLQKVSGENLIAGVVQLGVKDATIENFAAKYKSDQTDYQRLLSSGLGKNHPKMVGLNKQIEECQKILLSAAESYRESLGINIRNLEDALKSVQGISTAKKEETVDEKQAAAEYARTKTSYETKLDLLNQMRETALKTQVNELLPGSPSLRPSNIFQSASDGEQRLFEETGIDNVEALQKKKEVEHLGLSSGMETRTYDIPTDFLSKGSAPKGDPADPFAARGGAGSQLTQRPDAKTILTQLGIEFPDGATAAYSASTGKLVVRNTREQLDNAKAVVSSMQDGKAAAGSDMEGILPLDFALPEGGTVYAFAGQYAPSAVAFRYQSWERRMQWSWLWMFTGAAGFLLLARRRPWFVGLAGMLLLQYLPGILGRPDWLPVANALVIGWVAGGLLRVVRWALSRKSSGRRTALPASVLVVLVMMVGLLPQEVLAEVSAEKATAEVPVVVVPYDPAHPDERGDQRYLSYETFERLWAAAKENRAKAAELAAGELEKGECGSTLTAGMHRAVVDGAVLRVESVFTLQTRGPDWVKVPFGLSGGLRSLLLDGTAAALTEGQLLVEKAGAHTVTAVFEVPLPAGWQEVSWQVPQATAGSLALSLALADPARPVVNGGAPQVESEVDGRRIFTVVLGAVERISLQRRTTAERAGAQSAVPPLAQVRTRVYVTPALERVESVVAFSFAGQAREAFSLRLEAGLIPVSFSVPGLENWALRREGEWQVLDLKLERPVRESFEVSLVAERAVGALPLTETAPQVSADAGRVELEWSVLATDDLEVRPQVEAELRRVGFVRAEGSGDEGFDAVGTWQSGGTAQALRWELRPKVPEASAVVRYALQPGAGKLELSAGMELRPAPGRELRELTIRVPAGSTIQGVTGERLSDWWHEDTALHVRFAGGAAEVTALALNLTQPLEAGAAEVAFKPLGIEGFSKVSGSGLVIAPLNQDAVLRLAPAGPALREVAPAETRSGFTIRRPFEEKRGFVFEGSDWTAVTRLVPLAERYDVDWVMEAEVRDSWVALNARVLVSLTRGGVERLVFTTPASAPEFRITSDDVRETVSVVEGNVRRYTVSFQTLMTGAVLFTLTGQMPHDGMAGLPDVEFPGAARTARFVIVNNKSEGELKVDAAGVEVTPREQVSFLPEELANGQSGAQFYAARAGWSMKLGVEKLESTAGQAALVLHADLTTSLLLNGDVWQRAVYVVQNRALQFLPVQLPADAEVVSVSVGGETTRADQGLVDGVPVMLVPLIQTAAGELATEVQLIYRRRGQAGKFPDVLDDPALPGLAVGQTFWTVQYPDKWQVDVIGGNMTSTDPTALDSEKAMSRLSELVSLRRIASSDKYDGETRAKAARNAQSVVSTFRKSVKQVDDVEISKALEDVQQEAAVPQEKVTNPRSASENEGKDGVRTKQFSYNKTTQQQVETLNSFKQEVQAGATALNDNVLWANGNLPAKGKPEAASVKKDAALNNGNRRLSQIDKLERGRKLDSKPQALELKDATKPDDDAMFIKGTLIVDPQPKQSDSNFSQEFSQRNDDYSFRNVRLNTLTAVPVPDLSNKPAAPAAPASAAAATATASPADDTTVDPFSSAGVRAGADDGMDADARRLRTSGRSSLEAVFPEQRNAVHFKKVKGDAALEIKLAQPVLGGVNLRAAMGLAGVLLLIWLGSWVSARIRK